VSARFPWIVALVASADSVPAIPDGSLDAVISTSTRRISASTPTSAGFRSLVTSSGFRIAALERRLLWFPLLDPLLFRAGVGSYRIAAPSARFGWQRSRSLATTASKSSSSADASRC
jgi:hypothetical protein